MPSIKRFRISLDPAERKPHGWVIELSMAEPPPSKIVMSSTLEGLRAAVSVFAADYGKPCHAHVECLESRKPAGFDKAFDFHSLFFNVEGHNG